MKRALFGAALVWKVPARAQNFPVVVLSKLRLLAPGLGELRLRDGLRFAFRHNTDDISALVSVAIGDGYPWGPLLRLPEGGVVLDLGGHIGSFAVALHHRRPDLRIFSIEASRENHALLCENLRRNRCAANVVPVHAAVCDFEGVAQLLGSGHTDAWHVARPGPGGDEEEAGGGSARALRLVTLLSEHGIERVDFIKMDIEGAEYAVLEDARPIIQRTRGVVLEFHTRIDGVLQYPDGEGVVYRYFQEIGFAPRRLDRSTVLATPDHTRGDPSGCVRPPGRG